MAVKEKITIMNARLVFKNFAGKKTEFNSEGSKNFCVRLSNEQAAELTEKGWPIRTRPAREGFEDEGNFNTLKVNVKFGPNPDRDPQVYRICNGKQVRLNEKTIGSLDWDDIQNVDLRIRPYNYEYTNRKGVSAYLESMYVTVQDDPLAQKYAPMESPIADEELPFD